MHRKFVQSRRQKNLNQNEIKFPNCSTTNSKIDLKANNLELDPINTENDITDPMDTMPLTDKLNVYNSNTNIQLNETESLLLTDNKLNKYRSINSSQSQSLNESLSKNDLKRNIEIDKLADNLVLNKRPCLICKIPSLYYRSFSELVPKPVSYRTLSKL